MPLSDPGEDESGIIHQSPGESAAPISILYLDDEPGLLLAVKLSLEDAGDCTVDTTESAEEALEKLRMQSYDAIISDYNMPDMDGIGFLHEVRERYGNIPFILYTGVSREDILITAINAGVTCYLQKEGDPGLQFAELMHMIRLAVFSRRSEQDLAEYKKKLGNVQKNARVGIFEYYPDSREIRYSPETYAIFGIGPGEREPFSASLRAALHPDDTDIPGETHTPVMTDTPPGGIVVRIVMKDGQTRWMKVTGMSGDDNGENPRMQGTIQDVTDLHNARDTNHRDEERFRLLIKNPSEIVTVMDKEKIFRYASESIHQVTGFQPEEIINKPFIPQMIYPDDYETVSRTLDDLIATPGGQRRMVYRHRHKNDGYIYLETIGTNLLDDPAINGIILCSRDFTDVKRAEERLLTSLAEIKDKNKNLEAMRAELNQVNGRLEDAVYERTRDLEESKEHIKQLLIQKDQFIYQLAHDLRTPLTPVVAMLPLLIIGITDPDAKSLLEIFNKSIQYLQKMVEDIIIYSQLNRQYSVTDYAEFSLQDLITDAVDSNSFPAEEKEITFIREIQDDITIRLSKSHSRQLFRNLVNNAVKYNSFKGKVTITGRNEKDGVTVTISDTGTGINPDVMDKIWDEFTTGDASRRDPESKGLGLPIVRRIVVLHGGTIRCFSEGTGKGTTFTLFIPNNYVPSDNENQN